MEAAGMLPGREGGAGCGEPSTSTPRHPSGQGRRPAGLCRAGGRHESPEPWGAEINKFGAADTRQLLPLLRASFPPREGWGAPGAPRGTGRWFSRRGSPWEPLLIIHPSCRGCTRVLGKSPPPGPRTRHRLKSHKCTPPSSQTGKRPGEKERKQSITTFWGGKVECGRPLWLKRHKREGGWCTASSGPGRC